MIVNWGSSAVPSWYKSEKTSRIVNPWDKVKIAANKLATFEALSQDDSIPIPVYTTDRATAADWCNKGVVVVCRTKLNGHSGAGITCAASEQDLVQAPLYVQYVKKKKEFRVHVAFGQVIDVQEKRRRADFEGEPNFAIRNHHTGWVYCREEILEPAVLREVSVKAVAAVGLDFGAVDVIWNEHHNKCYVLEINTACGLEGATVESYAQAFIRNVF